MLLKSWILSGVFSWSLVSSSERSEKNNVAFLYRKMNIFKCFKFLYKNLAQGTDLAKSLEGSGFVQIQWFRIHHTGISGASQAYSSVFYSILLSNYPFCWIKIYKYSQYYRNKLRNCMCNVSYITKITNLRIWVRSKIFMMGSAFRNQFSTWCGSRYATHPPK